MKIGQILDNSIGQALNTGQTGQTTGVGQGHGRQGLTSSRLGLDRAEVSDIASTASRVLGASTAQRAEHVAKLAQLYQSGQYSVDPSRLSSAIIDHDSEPDPTQHSSK